MSKITARLDVAGDPPILVNQRVCDLCGGCVAVCPPDCIKLDERKLTIRGSDCIKCGFCIPVCPVEALSWNESPSSNGEDYQNGG